jgi:hypothetical protein
LEHCNHTLAGIARCNYHHACRDEGEGWRVRRVEAKKGAGGGWRWGWWRRRRRRRRRRSRRRRRMASG